MTFLAIGCSIILLALLVGPQVMGGEYEHQIRMPGFGGATLDSGRVVVWTGADSTSTKRLTVGADSTAITSVADSVTLSDTAVSKLVYSLYFFGQGAEGPEPEIIPPLLSTVGGGAVDSNRTEQGGAGTGPFRLKYYCFDTLGGGMVPVNDLLVTAKNWALSANVVQNRTDVNGLVILQSGVDSLASLAQKTPLYIFPTAWDSTINPDSLTDTLLGYLNVPDAAPGVNAVTVYLDVGTGAVDSAAGTMLPRTRVEYKLSLVGQPDMRFIDSTWMVVPEDQVKRPDTAGRIQFTVIPTQVLTDDPYYTLSFRSLGRYSRWSGEVFKFEVDTLPDPINILDCRQVP